MAVAAVCGFVVALMVGAAYAAVPFYNWFCRVTGFDGTTQVATASPTFELDRTIAVRFDANVSGGLPWKFEPEQTEIEVQIGAGRHRLLQRHQSVGARRPSGRRPTTSRRSTVGSYFNKIDCFCFTEQRSARREARDGGRVLCRSGDREGFRQ